MSNTFYGFDDYNVVIISSSLLTDMDVNSWSLRAWWEHINLIPLSDKYHSEYYGNGLSTDFIENHKELLETAKSLYVHPSCSIPRTSISQKYKKNLNPWLADAVVIPIPDSSNSGCIYEDAVFINENAKMVLVVSRIYNDDLQAKLKDVKKGTKVKDLIYPETAYRIEKIISSGFDAYNLKEALDAEFDYYGKMLHSEKKSSYVFDIVSGAVPESKLVFESDVIRSLSGEENALTFENLVSLQEMLSSTDEDIVASAVKALSSMDYPNYPNSVKYILSESSMWKYNKATHTTAAKYMFKFLLGGTARSYIRFRDKTISEDDYNILKRLVEHYQQSEQGAIEWLRIQDFTYEDENYNVFPRLKK